MSTEVSPSDEGEEPSAPDNETVEKTDNEASRVEGTSVEPAPESPQGGQERERERSRLRRAQGNRIVQRFLIAGGVVTTIVVVTLLFVRRDAGARVDTACLRAWNSPSNLASRYLAAKQAAQLGPAHQGVWVGDIVGRCTVGVIASDGKGVIWHQEGRAFVLGEVRPGTLTFPFAARAATRPNATLKDGAIRE